MADHIPRIRMFAGPNGSGKSTIRDDVKPEWLGYYVNADEIEKSLGSSGGLSLNVFDIFGDIESLKTFLSTSTLAERHRTKIELFSIEENMLSVVGASDSYLASIIADYIRHELLKRKASFTFETVMSHRSKVDLLKQARLMGYRTYLYYIATETPQINIDRVALRVKNGGHDVPESKIIDRYAKSLELLPEAIFRSDRAFIFDNSGDLDQRVCFAEFESGTSLSLLSSNVPQWFQKAVLDKLETSP